MMRMTLKFEEKGLPKASYANDLHHLYIYLNGDLDTRGKIIVNHPDAIGFVYLQNNIITEAYLPEKVVNFTTSSSEKWKMIVAFSGNTDDCRFIHVPQSILLSNTLYLIDSSTLNKKPPVISKPSFTNNNKDELPDLPDGFNTEAKLKNQGSFLSANSTY